MVIVVEGMYEGIVVIAEVRVKDGKAFEDEEGAIEGENDGIIEAVLRRRLDFVCLAATECC